MSQLDAVAAASPFPSRKAYNNTIFKILTLGTLLVTLVGAFFGMFSIGSLLPLLCDDLSISLASISGTVLFYSRLARIPTKFLVGPIVDSVGGKPLYILGLCIIGCSLLAFGLPIFDSSLVYLTVCWSFMQVANAMVWPAAVKITGRWVLQSHLGRTLSVLSLSYLFGDALIRGSVALEIAIGMSWRWIMIVFGIVLFVFVFFASVFVRSSPSSIALCPQIKRNKQEEKQVLLEGAEGAAEPKPWKPSILQRLAATGRKILHVLLNPRFYLIAIMYSLLTIVRWVLSDMWVMFLVQVARMDKPKAAGWAILLPIAGGFGSLFMGFLQDKLPATRKVFVMLVWNIVVMVLVFALWMLSVLADLNTQHNAWMVLPPHLIFVVLGFFIMGTYTLPNGLLAVRLGGPELAATVSALLDAISSIGAALSGLISSNVLDGSKQGWSNLFAIQLIFAVAVVVVTFVYQIMDVADTVSKDFSDARKALEQRQSHLPQSQGQDKEAEINDNKV